MSSTNRGRARVEGDFYETPAWCVEAILPHLPRTHRAFDPAAGNGAILRVLASNGYRTEGVELDEARASAADPSLSIRHGDGLKGWEWGNNSLVIMNPPYSLALEFLQCALSQVGHGGTVAALLRLAFLETAKRAAFHVAHPSDVYVLSKRPSFTGGATDSCAYAWFVWGPGRGGRWSILGGS